MKLINLRAFVIIKFTEWKRSATSTVCRAVGLPYHGTVWVRVSLAAAQCSPPSPRDIVSLCFVTFSAEEFCPSLAASPAGVWAAQGTVNGYGHAAVGPVLGNGVGLNEERC